MQKELAIIPAHNEAFTIGTIVKEALNAVGQVLVIDDGSTDKTASIAERAGAFVISNKACQGQGKALCKGFNWAKQRKFTAVVCIDGDGAHPAKLATRLLSAVRDNRADIALGSRFILGSKRSTMPSSKQLANRIASAIVSASSGVGISDPASGFRALSKKVFSQEYLAEGYSLSYEILARIQTEGWILQEIPIEVRYDANEPLITCQRELKDFFLIINRWNNHHLHPGISSIINKIDSYTKFSVEILSNNKCEYIIALPIHEYGGYIFQLQHSFFRQLHKDNRRADLSISLP